MLKACSLVVLTLVLHLQLCSSAPTPAKVVQVRGARPEEPAPVTEDLSNLMEEKEADDEKVLTAVPGQAAPSPDEENMFIAKEPEPISSEDHVSDDDFLEAGELASQEPSAGAHHESSEDETVSEEAAFVESSPEEATDNIAPAVAFESEHFVENTAPKEEDYFVPVPAELEREEAGQWETAAEEHALFVPADPAEEDLNREDTVLIIVDQNGGTVQPAAEQTASQVPAPEDLVDFAPLGPTKVEMELREQVVEESIPVVSPEAPKEDAAGGLVQIVPEEDPATMEEALAGPPKEEQSVVSDTEEKGQVELAAEETSPVLEEPAPEDPILICLEGPKDDAPENNVEVEADPSDTQETTPEEVAAGDSTSDLLLTSVTESDSNPTGEVQDAATEVLTESLIEAVKFRALR